MAADGQAPLRRSIASPRKSRPFPYTAPAQNCLPTIKRPHHYATSLSGIALPSRAQSASKHAADRQQTTTNLELAARLCTASIRQDNTTNYKRLAQLGARSFHATLFSTPPPPNLRCSCTAASRRFAIPRNMKRPDTLAASWYSRQAGLHGCCSISQCTGV